LRLLSYRFAFFEKTDLLPRAAAAILLPCPKGLKMKFFY
jgi:hypothetical protein